MTLITGRELAQKILDQITAHPETHAQDSWRSENGACGTMYCIAGWAVVLNWQGGEGDPGRLLDGRRAMARELNTIPHWGALGQKLLGLDDEAADDLFFSDTMQAPALLAELFELEYTEPEAGE